MNNATTRAMPLIGIGFAAAGILIPAVAGADHPTLGLQQDGAGAITTLTAITLPKGVGTFGFESQYLSNNEIGDLVLAHFTEEGEQAHSVENVSNLSLNAAYGFTDRLTIGMNLPHVTRAGIREGAHHHEEEGGQTNHDAHEDEVDVADTEHTAAEAPEINYLGSSSGIGDLTIYGQYRFLGDEDSGVHLSALMGVKTPTGKTDDFTNAGQRFESELQPGSGSWDVLAGMAFTRQWSKTSLDSNVLYTFSGDGSQHSNLGDIFNYNIAMSYRYGHDSEHGNGAAYHDHDAPGNSWDAALEINGEWRGYVTVGGIRQTHTGGNLVYLAPSVRFNHSKGWTAYVSLGIPVLENLNGVQSDPKFRLFIGISAGLGNAQ